MNVRRKDSKRKRWRGFVKKVVRTVSITAGR